MLEPAELIAEARSLRVELDEVQLEQLQRYVGLLLRWNKRVNLLSRRDTDRVWSRHVLDALSIRFLIGGPKVMDLGSGGGLPGIPLAITTPDHEFTLLDRSERKTRFLTHAVATLGLENVTVHCVDVAHLPGSLAGSFAMDTIVSRAVAPPATLWQMAHTLLRANGKMVLMSAVCHADSQQRAVLTAAADGTAEEVHHMDIPGLDQQHEVLVIHRCK